MRVKLNEKGSLTGIAGIVLLVMVLVASLAFGGWAFAGRQDYKNKADEKIAKAVEVAKQQAATAKDNEFLEREKEPTRDFLGTETFGSLSFKYPKSWSVYMAAGANSPFDNYYNPNFVPSIGSSNTYALRAQVVEQSYKDVIKQFDANVKNGTVSVTAYRAKLVPSVLGIRANGAIISNKNGSMVILPLRDKTIKVWTESTQLYGSDFEKFILPTLTFVP